MNKKKHLHRGSSMLIAIGLGALLVLIVIGAISLVLSALQSTQRIESRNKAYFIAEGGIELALYDLGRHGTGYEVNPSGYEENWDTDAEDGEYSHLIAEHSIYSYVADTDPDRQIDLPEEMQGWWGIRSLAKMDSPNEYIIPARGEGNAGTDCDLTDDWELDASHPCNWNKINIISSANVSLYRDNTDPGEETTKVNHQSFKQINGVDLNTDSFIAKVRIPGQYDYLFVDGAKQGELSADETIVGWFFSGKDSDGVNQLFYADSTFDKSGDENYRTECNSEITASLLNDARDGVVFSQADFTSNDDALVLDLDLHGYNTYKEGGEKCDNDMYDAINAFFGGTSGDATELQNFRFSLVSNINDEDDNKVENLEYQIVADRQIPDTYITIDAEGFVGSYPQVYRQHIRMRIKQNESTPVYDFAFMEG